MDDIGQRIRALRKAKGLTLVDIGEHFGIHRASVSGWEHGRSYPDVRRLPELADLLNTTVEYILTGKKTTDWPFVEVNRHRVLNLNRTQLRELSLALATALSIIESRPDDHGDNTPFPSNGTDGPTPR